MDILAFLSVVVADAPEVPAEFIEPQSWLNLLWFVLLGVLLAGYAILDGFDLGVGILHLSIPKSDTERRIFLNSIGPLWDGNEVWLVTFGGALFAAFPNAYATAFSGFYLPFMALLFALIFRAVSIEFRGKRESKIWRGMWDFGFFGASALAPFLFGVAVGTSMKGLPLDAYGEFTGNLLDLLGVHAAATAPAGFAIGGGMVFDPYPAMIGLLVVATFAMHGAIFLYLKTSAELQARIVPWMWRTFGVFLVLDLITTIYTLTQLPHATRNFTDYPAAWIVVVLNILAIANIPRAIHQGKPFYAFVSSACTIAALVFLFGAALFPYMIISTLDPAIYPAVADTARAVPESSLTIYNAASSQKTLGIMAIVAAIGMPFVLTYTAIVYWVFRGKVELGTFSY